MDFTACKKYRHTKFILVFSCTIFVLLFYHRQDNDKNNRVSVIFQARWFQSMRQGRFEFPIAGEHVCQMKQPLVIVCVITSPSNIARRQQWRSRFANGILTDRHKGRPSVGYIFLIGQTSNDALQSEILEESKRHHDLVQASFQDSYKNLTTKSWAMLQWHLSYCRHVDYLVKIDDDVFLNLPQLVAAIQNASHSVQQSGHGTKQDFVLGRYVSNHFPSRNPKSKWYVPYEFYNERRYPDYTNGAVYALTTGAAMKIYEQCEQNKFPPLEDLFITGICRQKAGVKIVFNEDLCLAERNLAYVPENCITFHNPGKPPPGYAPQNDTLHVKQSTV